MITYVDLPGQSGRGRAAPMPVRPTRACPGRISWAAYTPGNVAIDPSGASR